jgi:hypothetical protein
VSDPGSTFPDYPGLRVSGRPESSASSGRRGPGSARLHLVTPRRKPPPNAARVLRRRDRLILQDGVRHRGLTASQAWRWHFPGATGPQAARNRLAKLAGAGLLRNVPRGRGQEGIYVPTRLGTRLSGLALGAPTLPHSDQLGKIGHDLTVAEAAHWLPTRSVEGATWLTWRELARLEVMSRPPRRRRGAVQLGELPDGALVLPSGERLAVEVELTDKRRRVGEKLGWYRAQLATDAYRSVLWLTHREAIARALRERIAAAGFLEHQMWVELLPPDVRVWTSG